jgi:hypothetical protein
MLSVAQPYFESDDFRGDVINDFVPDGAFVPHFKCSSTPPTRFFRVYSKPLVSSYPLFSINRMTDPNLGESLRAIDPCLPLRRCARLLTPKR